MGDSLALIPAIDQNGLLVMIPPSLITPGSMFTPILNTDSSENRLLQNDIQPNPISDMQSLLGYDPFMNTYSNPMNFLNYAPPPPQQQPQLPPQTNVNFSAFPTSPSYKDFVD